MRKSRSAMKRSKTASATLLLIVSLSLSGGSNSKQAEPGTYAASDALFVLQAATGLRTCESCICDVNASGGVTATDALAVLRAAVGQAVELTCPACGT